MLRRRRSSVFGVVAILLLFPRYALGLTYDEAYNQLRDAGGDYETVAGNICEDVAALEYSEMYPPPAFQVMTRVAYWDARTKQISGELDVVIIDNDIDSPPKYRDPFVLEVAEVKCWPDLSAAHARAVEQRENFLRALDFLNDHFFFSLDKRGGIVPQRYFFNTPKYTTVSQSGGEYEGFDWSLSLSLTELRSLGKMLSMCQKKGHCRAPSPKARGRGLDLNSLRRLPHSV